MRTQTRMTQWYTRAATKTLLTLQAAASCRPFIPPRPSQHLTMATTGSNRDDLDAIFKQKRALRTQVRKALKAIDPSLRSQQGSYFSHFHFLDQRIGNTMISFIPTKYKSRPISNFEF